MVTFKKTDNEMYEVYCAQHRWLKRYYLLDNALNAELGHMILQHTTSDIKRTLQNARRLRAGK